MTTKAEIEEIKAACEAAERVAGDLAEQVKAAEATLPKMRGAILATAGDREAYREATAAHQEAKDEAGRLRVAHRAASDDAKALRLHLVRLGNADAIARSKAKINRTITDAQKLTDALTSAVHYARKLYEDREAIAIGWPGGSPPQIGLAAHELLIAIRTEIYRLSAKPDEQLGVAKEGPNLFPGGHPPQDPKLWGQPAKIPTLVDWMTGQAAFTIDVLEGKRNARSGAIIDPGKPPVDHEGLISEEELAALQYGDPDAPKVTADQVMAMMPRKRKLA
jgi:hypothetical protein